MLLEKERIENILIDCVEICKWKKEHKEEAKTTATSSGHVRRTSFSWHRLFGRMFKWKHLRSKLLSDVAICNLNVYLFLPHIAYSLTHMAFSSWSLSSSTASPSTVVEMCVWVPVYFGSSQDSVFISKLHLNKDKRHSDVFVVEYLPLHSIHSSLIYHNFAVARWKRWYTVECRTFEIHRRPDTQGS